MQDLNVTLVQADIEWENREANLIRLAKMILSEAEKVQPDLVVLPEMFTTGFSMDPIRLAEPHRGLTFAWMQELSAEINADIMGSFIVKDGGNYYNRLYWVAPDGYFDYYDKRHLFRMAEEHLYYTSGNRRLIAKIKGWYILPLICYDLRFPVWSANRFDREYNDYEYDCIVYVANWPDKRAFVWDSLLEARAHENICYVVGVNRVGVDGRGVYYSGGSKVISPKGTILADFEKDEINIKTVTLSADDLLDFRDSFPVGLDFDDFTILE